MSSVVDPKVLSEKGLVAHTAEACAESLNQTLQAQGPVAAWLQAAREWLSPQVPFEVHWYLYQTLYDDWNEEQGPKVAWSPDKKMIENTLLGQMMQNKGLNSYADFHHWSCQHRGAFWRTMVQKMGILFSEPFDEIVDMSKGPSDPVWFPHAKMNIADSCFQAASNAVAVRFQNATGAIQEWTYAQLDKLSNQVANGLQAQGFKPGDAIGIDMLMNAQSVAIYLGILKAGCVVISIADSFSSAEIKTRLRLGQAKGIFTQDVILRAAKQLPMYQKVIDAEAPRAIVLPAAEDGRLNMTLRQGDIVWDDFLSENKHFESVPCDPLGTANILFSSGTTGDPKAIPWNHTTPIKCGADGMLHQNIKPGDVVAWPTNLGWMMGPWLIFASLLNRATIALYADMPIGPRWAQFVEQAKVQVLGVVPSLVKTWMTKGCTEDADWTGIKCFSSTGECSNAREMLWLMGRADYAPVIEYCGGTEIGGGYMTGTMVQDAAPATFSTPALGLDFVLLDEEGKETQQGEVYLVPPSIGLSLKLLNKDHHKTYYADTPTLEDGQILRRHGDAIQKIGRGYYRAHGRADDTMNLGGIKVSSAEIERTLNRHPDIVETAAIAMSPPDGGPSFLVIYAVCHGEPQLDTLQKELTTQIKKNLNPLFKIHTLKVVEKLPRTASGKVMRRILRDSGL